MGCQLRLCDAVCRIDRVLVFPSELSSLMYELISSSSYLRWKKLEMGVL